MRVIPLIPLLRPSRIRALALATSSVLVVRAAAAGGGLSAHTVLAHRLPVPDVLCCFLAAFGVFLCCCGGGLVD